jgi:7,8-dihydroneopterin aldolase/epimerase/oxygenase
MDRILLQGLTFFGKHGCHGAENELGQKFIVDIALDCDLRAAGASDDLNDTLNYVAIYEAAQRIIEGPSAKLLEYVAEKIAGAALEHEIVQSVTVRIRKPHIALPVALEFLGVEITRRRDEL